MIRPHHVLASCALMLSAAPLAHAGGSTFFASTARLTDARHATLRTTSSYWKTHPQQQRTCLDLHGEWHTDVVAFPAGRSDRVFIFTNGTGLAFEVVGTRATLL